MTHVIPATRPISLQPRASVVLASLLLLGVGYQWLQHAQMVVSVWREGRWYDTDDAMRMVGVRALLEGQGWFDLVAHRMGGDAPVVMHWSRVVDVPLALMIRLFGLFTTQPMAETLTRLAFPAALLALLMIALINAAKVLGGPAARWPALVLGALGGPTAEQFVPGRIDHHAPQIVLLAFMTGALLKSFRPDGNRQAALAGALAALSLSISIENVPFFLAVIACLGLRWICLGEPASGTLRNFAAGLGSASIVLFALTVPPNLWTAPVCDAFGAPYAVAVLAGCAVLGALTIRTSSHVLARCLAAMTGLGALLLLIQAVYPGCLGSPFGDMPPLLRDLWLKHVSEAQPLTEVLRKEPGLTLTYLGPPLAALVASLWLGLRSRGAQRDGHLLLFALTVAGLLAAAWMVRAASSLGVPVMIACATVAATVATRIKPEWGKLMPTLLPIAVSVGLSSTFLAMLSPQKAEPDKVQSDARAKVDCTAAGSLAELSRLPTMRLLSLVDAGPMILAQTAHSVFAAPYHRNIEGNLAALQTFRAKPDEAHALVRKAGASHVAFCANIAEVDVIKSEAPDGLAARLAAGEVPDWLTPISPAGVWRVFRVD